MKRNHLISSSLLAATAVATFGLSATTVTASADAGGRPASYLLQGDAVDAANPAVPKFEGIGADERRGLFYVSEVTGGEIHKGSVRQADTEQWIAGERRRRPLHRARHHRGPPRATCTSPAARTASAPAAPTSGSTTRTGNLLTALRVPGTADAFLNDVAIGPDGAAYFTNSNDPQVFRVAAGANGWEATLWADATGTITRSAGFNLGGIVPRPRTAPAFVVAQGNVGADVALRHPHAARSPRSTSTDADLVNADGLVRQGDELTVVRNFSRMIATLEVSEDGRELDLVGQRASSADRVLTTAKTLRGRVLYVDSKFDEAVASGPYEVVTDPTR